jgi:pilus assembly protein CpaB
MRNNILPLLIGLIIAAASIFMLRGYLDDQRKNVLKQAHETVMAVQENQIVIFVARNNIPAGVPINPSLVDTMAVLRSQAPQNAVRFFSELDGKASNRAISTGEPVTSDALRIISFDETSSKQLSQLIPQGKRAVSIVVDNIASLLNMIKPADHVDVVVVIGLPVGQNQKELINVPLFQDILVLAVGDSYGSAKTPDAGSSIKKLIQKAEDTTKKIQNQSGNPPITLALSPEEANVISFVQEEGKIKLILRSPTDTGTVNYENPMASEDLARPMMNYQAFIEYLIARGILPPPKQQPKPEQAAAPKAKGPEVEIFRGQNKEVKELIK